MVLILALKGLIINILIYGTLNSQSRLIIKYTNYNSLLPYIIPPITVIYQPPTHNFPEMGFISQGPKLVNGVIKYPDT